MCTVFFDSKLFTASQGLLNMESRGFPSRVLPGFSVCGSVIPRVSSFHEVSYIVYRPVSLFTNLLTGDLLAGCRLSKCQQRIMYTETVA